MVIATTRYRSKTTLRPAATPLGLDDHFRFSSQGSRGGNPGLEDATALRLIGRRYVVSTIDALLTCPTLQPHSIIYPRDLFHTRIRIDHDTAAVDLDSVRNRECDLDCLREQIHRRFESGHSN